MICSNCGNPVDGTRKFCQVCGYPVKQVAEDSVDTGLFSGTPASNNTITDLNSFQNEDYSINKPSYPQPATPTESNNDIGYEEKPKKNIVKKLLIPVVAVVLAAVIALSGWGIFLAVNPEVRIARAFEKTLFGIKSFAFEASVGDREVAEGYVSFGKTTFTSDFSVDLNNGMHVVCDDGQLLIPLGSEHYFAVDMPAVFGELVQEVDNVVYEVAQASTDEVLELLENRYNVTATPEQAAEWAETLIKNKTINEDVIKDIWNTVGVPLFANELDIDEKDVPDYKEIKSILAGAFTKGIKGDAFKVVDTRKDDGIKYYECEIFLPELAKGMIEYALDCKKLGAILDADPHSSGHTFRDTLESYLEIFENEEYPDYLDEEVEFTIGIKNGYLVAFEYDGFEIVITDINKKHDAKDDYAEAKEKAYRLNDLDLDNILFDILGFGGRKDESSEMTTYYY